VSKDLCFIMYVSRDKYYHYIPFFLWSVAKAYPEYFTFIGIKGTLPEDVERQVSRLNGSRFHIASHVFEDYPDDVNIVKTLRWVWYMPEFEAFKSIYIGDIDILITRENPPLFKRHSKICEKEGLDYSNTTAIDPVDTRGLRMTGLHFAYSRPYFTKMRPVMTKYARILEKHLPFCFWNDKLGKFDNQHALAVMMEEIGYKLPDHKFFEYNGLHLGHSRIAGRWAEMFKDPVHIGYFKEFKSYLDSNFDILIEETRPDIRAEIREMVKYGERCS